MLTNELFYQHLRTLTQAKNFCIALSGGLDSIVLLSLFNQIRQYEPHLQLRAIHIHHGLSINADHWSRFCEKICDQYGIPCIIEKIELQKIANESLEALARQKRYQVLRDLLQNDEIIVTAHHQEDQAETLLLQLFRGAGPKGLASMPTVAQFGKGLLMRPLLDFTKAALQEYAHTAQLKWCEDESNRNLSFDRNFLRHELLPLIQSRWPGIMENLARTAKHCARANQYIEKQIVHAFQETFHSEKKCLLIPVLLSFDIETQKYIIRYWLQHLGLPLPSTKKLQLLQNEILLSREDRMPLLRWKEVEVRRYRSHLYAMSPLSKHDPFIVINWNLQSDLLLPNNLGAIKLNDLSQLGLPVKDLQAVTVRFRRGGERCRLKNRQHTHCLKKLFQQWGVPPWLRDRIPLLYSNDELKAVIGFTVCD